RTVAESFAQTKPAPTAICASKFVLLWTNGIGTGFPIGCPSGASWITPAKPREAARGGLGPGGDGDFPSPDTSAAATPPATRARATAAATSTRRRPRARPTGG